MIRKLLRFVGCQLLHRGYWDVYVSPHANGRGYVCASCRVCGMRWGFYQRIARP